MNVRLTVAREYHRDARHYLRRFGLLPVQEFDKAGRIKNVVDLYMAAECALKAHIFAGQSNESPLTLYKKIRKSGGHDLGALADMADYLGNRNLYAAVQHRFEGFSVSLRYSLDAWGTYFPFGVMPNASTDQYDQTIANLAWINSARNEIQALVDSVAPALAEVVQGIDVNALLAYEKEMKTFVEEAGIAKAAN